MVMGTAEICTVADVIFIIEGTAINGAYLSEMKNNYIIPTLEHFNQGSIEERDYGCESTSALYGVVIYHAADRLPSPCTDIYGPYSNPHRVLQVLDKIELIGGRGESYANVAEGFAASLVCLDDLQLRRENGANPQKHCILICNSPPYMMPVIENQSYTGNTAEQLASIFSEKNVHLSIISPRKIPLMFKLFEKAGGDLSASQTKNFAKDPRHLVLLKGFSLPSLKERPVSPTAAAAAQHSLNVASLSSPIPSHGSPMSAATQPQPPQPNQTPQPILQGTAGVPVVPPTPTATGAVRTFPPPAYARSQWRNPMMVQRPPNYPSQPGSALIEQLTRPPSAIAPQFTDAAAGLSGATMSAQNPQQQPMPPQQTQVQPNQAPNQMRMLNTSGVINQRVAIVQPQPNVLGPNQQGLMPQPAGVMQPGNVSLINQGQPPQTSVMQPQQPPVMQQPPPQPQGTRERQTIWSGILEWIEKKSPGDSQKLTRHVPCQVSANYKDGGEPELKADSWPQKLIMQLMPKQLIGNIGGAYLKNSKSVLFHPQPCDALEALTKVMGTGFAGCVHFTSAGSPGCDIKVLILLYTSEKRAYLGFIPNDQVAFVDRLRKVIQHQKSNRQVGATGGQAGPGPALGGPQVPPTSQGPIGAMLQQPPQQQQQPLGATLRVGQTMSPMLSTIPGESQQQQQQGSGQGQFNTHLVEARQENLFKIQQLQQTLEAAQQQEQQYKSQLEVTSNYYSPQIMNQMKMQQLQDNVGLQRNIGQAPQDQFKAQLEQEQQKQLRAQLQQMQAQQQQQQQQQQVRGLAPQQQAGVVQQRMMRPPISNNQLRHLLQGPQPQYRMNMGQQQMVRAGLQQSQGQQMSTQQQQFDDVSSYDFLN